MKHYYEILLALKVGSQEEEIKEILERLEKLMVAEGAAVEEVQRLERKEFAYPHNHLKAGYYVNFVIALEPAAVEKIRQKLTLVEEVVLQNYYRKGSVTAVAKPKAVRKKKAVVAE
jgi:ribosomal protein S6